MDSFYSDQNYKYPELCIVKEEFNIKNPGIVKCYIPALMPFIKEDEPKLVKFRPSNSHLDNDEKDEIEPSGNSHTANYILVNLPSHITDVTRDLIITTDFYDDSYIPDESDDKYDTEDELDFNDDIVEDEIYDDTITRNIVGYTPKCIRRLRLRKRYFFPISRYDKKNKILYAKKNQKFIAVFIGGSINNIKIIGRYDECPLQEPTLSPTYLPSEVQLTSPTTEPQ